MTPKHPSPPTTRRAEYRERCAWGCEQWPPNTRFPEDPNSQFWERVLGAVNSGPRALGSLRAKRGHFRERVLGDMNSDPRALGSPTAQEVLRL